MINPDVVLRYQTEPFSFPELSAKRVLCAAGLVVGALALYRESSRIMSVVALGGTVYGAYRVLSSESVQSAISVLNGLSNLFCNAVQATNRASHTIRTAAQVGALLGQINPFPSTSDTSPLKAAEGSSLLPIGVEPLGGLPLSNRPVRSAVGSASVQSNGVPVVLSEASNFASLEVTRPLGLANPLSGNLERQLAPDLDREVTEWIERYTEDVDPQAFLEYVHSYKEDQEFEKIWQSGQIRTWVNEFIQDQQVKAPSHAHPINQSEAVSLHVLPVGAASKAETPLSLVSASGAKAQPVKGQLRSRL